MKYKLDLLPYDEESELGDSHFLGCPDVPSIWNDEAEFYNDEIFVGQINLKNQCIEGLPKEGILYFFLATGSRPYRPIVRYTLDTSNLERIDFNSEIDFPFDLDKEYVLSKESGEDIKIFEEAPKFKNYHLKNNEIVLLDLSTDPLKIFDNIDDHVCYIINKDDLVTLNFKNVKLSLVLNF